MRNNEEILLRPTTLRTPPTRHRYPVAGEHIAQGKGKQDEQKEEADGRKNPGEPTAVAEVHEVKNHQHRFGRGDAKGYRIVHRAEVEKCHPNGSGC